LFRLIKIIDTFIVILAPATFRS